MCGTVMRGADACRVKGHITCKGIAIGTWEVWVWRRMCVSGTVRIGKVRSEADDARHEKSDLAIVAEKPTNKARKAPCGGVCGAVAAESVERRAGPRGIRTSKARTGLRSRLTCHGRWSVYGNLCRHTPEAGAVSGKPHVRIGRGACHEMHVPTATTARVHHAARRHGSRVVARGKRAATRPGAADRRADGVCRESLLH